MTYSINMSNIPLVEFKKELVDNYLIPSQRILRDNIDLYFNNIKNYPVETMEDLYKHLKNKKNEISFAEISGIPLEYIIVLSRSVRSYISTPRKIMDFPTIADSVKEKLLSDNINNSKKLFDFFTNTSQDKILSDLNITTEEFHTIYALIDVSRLRYVSPLFATVLIKSGYTSINLIADSIPEVIYYRLKEVNDKEKIYKGNIGQNDMRFLIDDAQFFVKWDAL